jgi:hypothetical protein
MNDSIDSYLDDTALWAALVVLDYIELENLQQCNPAYLDKVLEENAWEFIKETFENEGLPCPSKDVVIERALERIK